MKKWAFLLLAFGIAFSGQIVNVGETVGGAPAPSTGAAAPSDAECYNQYAQCLREGCAAARGSFSEQTQGCYGGDDAAFAKAVGECARRQGECVMGESAGQPAEPAKGGIVPDEEAAGACPMMAIALCLLATAAYISADA
ncbi:MAG: hypothetical protein QXH30_00280 [Candidatus Bilamarchaeaceae archaeon]